MCTDWKFVTPPEVVDDDYWPNRELGYPREPIHGDDLPRPDDEPGLPLAGDRW